MAISKVNSPYTKIQDVPDVPTIGTATEGEESAEVAFTPATTGGRAYQYRALSSPGSIEAVGSSSPITVPGLTADTTYSFQVRAESNTGATNGYSSASNSIVPTASGAYDLLETTILTSSAGEVTFSNIDSYTDYKHLQVRLTVRDDNGGAVNHTFLRLNGNNLTTRHFLYGNGSTVDGSRTGNIGSETPIFWSSAAGNPTGAYNAAVVDILDYANTSKNTTVRTLAGGPGVANIMLLTSALWANTAAVTSITFDPRNAANFVAGSRFSLYGIKAA